MHTDPGAMTSKVRRSRDQFEPCWRTAVPVCTSVIRGGRGHTVSAEPGSHFLLKIVLCLLSTVAVQDRVDLRRVSTGDSDMAVLWQRQGVSEGGTVDSTRVLSAVRPALLQCLWQGSSTDCMSLHHNITCDVVKWMSSAYCGSSSSVAHQLIIADCICTSMFTSRHCCASSCLLLTYNNGTLINCILVPLCFHTFSAFIR